MVVIVYVLFPLIVYGALLRSISKHQLFMVLCCLSPVNIISLTFPTSVVDLHNDGCSSVVHIASL